MEKFDEHTDPKTGDPCDDLSDLKGRIQAAFGESKEFWGDMTKEEEDVILVFDDLPFKPVRMAASLNAAGEMVVEEPFVDFVLRTFRKPLEINPEAEKEKAKIDVERAKRPLFNGFRPSLVRMSSLSYRVSLENEDGREQEDEMEWWHLLERIQAFPMAVNPEAEKEKELLDIEKRNRPKPTFVPKRISIDHEYRLNGKFVYPCELHPYAFTLDDLFPLRKENDEVPDVVEAETLPLPSGSGKIRPVGQAVTACVEPKAEVEVPKPKQGWFKRTFGWLIGRK